MEMREYYYKPIINEDEYEDDLKLFQRLIRNINRYRNGTAIDKQLIVNQLIELFNMFQHEATIVHLIGLVNPEHRPAIKALIRSICQREIDFEIDGVLFSSIPTDYEFLRIIEEESQALGIRRGNIC
jgi:hypothetical protein